MGGARRAEAERRRALALKALDQRLMAASTRGGGGGGGALSTPGSAVTNVQVSLNVDAPRETPDGKDAKDKTALMEQHIAMAKPEDQVKLRALEEVSAFCSTHCRGMC